MPNEIVLVASLIIIYSMVLGVFAIFKVNGLYLWTIIATITANIEVMILVHAFGMDMTLGNVLFGSTFLVTIARAAQFLDDTRLDFPGHAHLGRDDADTAIALFVREIDRHSNTHHTLVNLSGADRITQPLQFVIAFHDLLQIRKRSLRVRLQLRIGHGGLCGA